MTQKQWINFSAVRAALSFSDVLAHYGLAAPTAATQLKISCPFHEETSPSCSINSERGIFRCFGCNASGNALDFIMRMEGGKKDSAALYQAAQKAITIMGRSVAEFENDNPTGDRTPSVSDRKAPRSAATAKNVGNTANNPKPSPRGSEGPRNQHRVKTTQAKVNQPLTFSLELNPEHPFLAARGISRATAELFELGYCNKGIMNGRIAIPIHNQRQELVAYVGRYAADPVPDSTERYRFPKGFAKGAELFNYHRALALQKNYLVVVEGYWSAIRLHRLGVPTVALMGTSISEQQVQLVAESAVRHVLVLLDGDEAGQAGAEQVAGALSAVAYSKRLTLPADKKPDDIDEQFFKEHRLCS